jgi:hypothetical protein
MLPDVVKFPVVASGPVIVLSAIFPVKSILELPALDKR